MQPLLAVVSQITFAWAGVVLVLIAFAYRELCPPEAPAFVTHSAAAFGSIAGALFLFFGLIGAFTTSEMAYLQSVRSTAYVEGSYLPLTLLMNRTFAAAITVSGLWFALANWIGLQSHSFRKSTSYLGIVAGVVALLGFVLPGGGFSPLSLLLSAVWGLLMGFEMLRD